MCNFINLPTTKIFPNFSRDSMLDWILYHVLNLRFGKASKFENCLSCIVESLNEMVHGLKLVYFANEE